MKIKKNTRYLIETEEDLQDFLERCEKKGWKWQTKDSPLDFTPDEIPCVIIYDTKSPREGLAGTFRTDWYDKVYKRKTPPTLAEFLGWEEGVEYKSRYGTRHKIVDDSLLFYHWQKKQWCTLSGKFDKRHIDILRSHKKYEPKHYYAKIKGWELNSSECHYWNYDIEGEKLEIHTSYECVSFKTKLTLQQWNDLGINDTNACFEEVKE